MGLGRGRAPCCDKSQVRSGPWSPAEDLTLINFIQKHGHSNWRALPKLAGLSRCGKSCRLRWMNYLRPDVKRGNFTPEEENTIIQLHHSFGNKWSKIASRLPGRTDNEIKNVWHTHLKKRLLLTTPTHSKIDSPSIIPTHDHNPEKPGFSNPCLNSPAPSSSYFSSLSSSSSSCVSKQDTWEYEIDFNFWEMLDCLQDRPSIHYSNPITDYIDLMNNSENRDGEFGKWLTSLDNELGRDTERTF